MLTLPEAEGQDIRFEDASSIAGLQTEGGGYGVAVGDYDNDGWDDIYLAAENGHSALFRNTGGGLFEDVTGDAGVAVAGNAVSPLWADINNDGVLDLFVGVGSGNAQSRFFLGTGTGSFVDISAEIGIDLSADVGSAAFGDVDNDGWVDLFMATRNSKDRLYRNVFDGERYFEDVSDRAGIGGVDFSVAMQATWIDYDRDADLDLFAVHDGNLKSRLYRNLSFLPLIESTNSARLEVARSAMGVAWGDYDNDGWPDVYITNIDRGNLFRNKGDGTFEDVTALTGTQLNGMSWGVVFADFDNDGDEDIFIGNTYDFDRRRSFLYENRKGKFVNVAEEAGTALSTNTFGVASGDFNNDGLVDLVVTDAGGDNRLLLNQTLGAGNWVGVSLKREGANTSAIGAIVEVVAGGTSFRRAVSGGDSFCSQRSAQVHVGIGAATKADTVRVTWAKGIVDVASGLEANRYYRITEGQPVRVGIDDVPGIQSEGSWSVFPNPMSGIGTLVFEVQQSGMVQIALYDATGRYRATLMNAFLSAGTHKVPVAGNELPAGIYFLRLVKEDVVLGGSVVVIR